MGEQLSTEGWVLVSGMEEVMGVAGGGVGGTTSVGVDGRDAMTSSPVSPIPILPYDEFRSATYEPFTPTNVCTVVMEDEDNEEGNEKSIVVFVLLKNHLAEHSGYAGVEGD